MVLCERCPECSASQKVVGWLFQNFWKKPEKSQKNQGFDTAAPRRRFPPLLLFPLSFTLLCRRNTIISIFLVSYSMTSFALARCLLGGYGLGKSRASWLEANPAIQFGQLQYEVARCGLPRICYDVRSFVRVSQVGWWGRQMTDDMVEVVHMLAAAMCLNLQEQRGCGNSRME